MATNSISPIASLFNCQSEQTIPRAIHSCLSEMDKVQLAFTCKKQRTDFVKLEEQFSHALMKSVIVINQKTEIFLTDENGKQEKTCVISLLGCGFYKGAWALENGTALLLPNLGGMSSRKTSDVTMMSGARWRRRVDEEIGMSRYLTSLHLLSPQNRKVRVALTKTAVQGSLPAYTSISFAQLAREGIFVIDEKSTEVTTWKMRPITKDRLAPPKQEADCIFTTEEERNNLENWEPVFDGFLTDFARIYIHGLACDYNVGLFHDSFHKAVVRRAHDPKRKTDFEVRYFGFDLSSPNEDPMPKPNPRVFNKDDAERCATWLFKRTIDAFLWNEFEGRVPALFLTFLTDKCVRTTLARMEEFSKQLAAPSPKSL